MASTPKNPDIGTCPCITCSTACPLRKRADKKLYVTCAKHGVYCPKDQEWIIDNATMWPEGIKPAEPKETLEESPPVEVVKAKADPDPPKETPEVKPKSDPAPAEDPPAGPGRNFRKYMSDLDSELEEYMSK